MELPLAYITPVDFNVKTGALWIKMVIFAFHL